MTIQADWEKDRKKIRRKSGSKNRKERERTDGERERKVKTSKARGVRTWSGFVFGDGSPVIL